LKLLLFIGRLELASQQRLDFGVAVGPRIGDDAVGARNSLVSRFDSVSNIAFRVCDVHCLHNDISFVIEEIRLIFRAGFHSVVSGAL
jgi:hypothetical protein